MKLSGTVLNTDVGTKTLEMEAEGGRKYELSFDTETTKFPFEYIEPGDFMIAINVKKNGSCWYAETIPFFEIGKSDKVILDCFPGLDNRQNVYKELIKTLFERYDSDLNKLYRVLTRYTDNYLWDQTRGLDGEGITVKEECYFYRSWWDKVIVRQTRLLGITPGRVQFVGVPYQDLVEMARFKPHVLFHLEIPHLLEIFGQPSQEEKKIAKKGKSLYIWMKNGRHSGMPLEMAIKVCGGDHVLMTLLEDYPFVLVPQLGGKPPLVCHREFYDTSLGVAKYLRMLKSYQGYQIEEYELEGLTEQQQNAIKVATQNGVSIITGGAGTGKTRTLGQLVETLRKNKVDHHIMTFTGKASSRIFALTGNQSFTIHRSFSLKLGEVKHVIMDESSMTEIGLMARFIRMANLRRSRFHLTLIGDKNQLEPIGHGRFFEEVIFSKQFPVCELTQNFRFSQGEECMITQNAHWILTGGRMVEKNNFFVCPPGFVSLRQVLENLKNRGMNSNDFYVLSPTNKPLDTINQLCQKIFNQGAISFQDPKYKKEWRLGDRVMVTVNNYESGVFNGEEGIITNFEYPHMEILFDSASFEQRKVYYQMKYLSRKKTSFGDDSDEILPEPTSSLSDLKLSYGVTIDKCQGDQKKYIFLFIPPGIRESGDFFNKRRLYTALTRAEHAFFCMGTPEKYEKIMRTNPSHRNEILAALLCS